MAVLVALACALAALVAAPTAAPAAASASAPSERQASLRSRSDAQLADLATRWDAEATAIGEQLLADDARLDQLRQNSDIVQRQLGEFLAEAYKDGSVGGGFMSELLASGSLREAADRVRLAQIVSDQHARLIRAYDRAEADLQVSELERAQRIARLSAVQGLLADVAAEQGRRAQVRAEAAADREAAAQAAANRRAQEAAATQAAMGTLVAGAPVAYAGGGGPASAQSIDAYLASKGSPMAGQGAAFMASGQRWRVDPRLLVAIAGAESNFGQVTCGPNNAWGWACPNDPADFGTWADGIDTVTRGLREYYLDEGRTSVTLIHQKYSPVGAANDPTGLNSNWPRNVTKFLLELGGNPASVGPGPSGAGIAIPSFGGLDVGA